MERLNEFLGDIRRKFFKDERFIGPEMIAPPEFDLTGYDDNKKPQEKKERHRTIEIINTHGRITPKILSDYFCTL